MSEGYKPPFTMTEEITNLVIKIAEMTGEVLLPDGWYMQEWRMAGKL